MSAITLEDIESTHNKLAEMIAAFKVQQSIFPITMTMPDLNDGEKYIGAIVSADGSKRHHLILLPGEMDGIKWQHAMEWAESIGGELPDRSESALLFATMKDEFKPEWYWTREQHASDSDYAWYQLFDYGDQLSDHRNYAGRARAVRRLVIE